MIKTAEPHRSCVDVAVYRCSIPMTVLVNESSDMKHWSRCIPTTVGMQTLRLLVFALEMPCTIYTGYTNEYFSIFLPYSRSRNNTTSSSYHHCFIIFFGLDLLITPTTSPDNADVIHVNCFLFEQQTHNHNKVPINMHIIVNIILMPTGQRSKERTYKQDPGR